MPESNPRHLQHDDGSWSLVGDDGRSIDLEGLRELHADAMAATTAVTYAPIDRDRGYLVAGADTT